MDGASSLPLCLFAVEEVTTSEGLLQGTHSPHHSSAPSSKPPRLIMKNQTSAPALLLFGLALVLLAWGSHAQEENCITEALSQAGGPLGGRGGRAMLPLVTRIMEQLKKRNAPEKMKHMMRTCVCSEESPDATEEQLCQCIAEIEQCEEMHKPNSTTPQAELKAKMNDLMDCMGEARLAGAIKCKETLHVDPTEMICEARTLKCSQE